MKRCDPVAGGGAMARPTTWSLLALWLVAALLCGAVPAHAQATREAASPAGLYEHEPILAGDTPEGSAATTRGASADARARRAGSFIEPQRIILALLIVLGIIFALRWIGQKYFPAVSGARSAGAVRVLARSPVAPKQQVLLLQVGRRVLVVADNGTQMNPLSEIVDPDEVASLIGQITSSQNSAVFESAFGKAQEHFDETMTNRAPAAESGDEAEVDQSPDSGSITSAQGEIKGLMDKVRGLAEQLGRTS